MDNPYSTPQSEVEVLDGNNGLDNFNRFSAWWVYLLTIVTSGLYPIYWLYTRSLIINRVHERPISGGVIAGAILTYVIDLALNLIPQGSFDTQAIILAFFSILYFFFFLWWLFAIRNRLQAMSAVNDTPGITAGPGITIGPVMTFFFQQIYLQYKINEYLDGKTTAETPAR